MSMFDKLKAYSRKPAAVILATVMATSTIPTTPIAQAVTAAYAAESTTTQPAKGAEKKSGHHSSAAAEVYRDYPAIRFIYDSYATDGQKTAAYFLSKSEAAETAKKTIQEAILSGKSAYTTEIMHAAIDDAFNNRIPEGQIVASKDDVLVDYSSIKIEDVQVDSVALSGEDNGFSVVSADGGWKLTAPEKNLANAQIGISIKSVKFSYNFTYKYTTKSDEQKPSNPGTGGDTGSGSEENSGAGASGQAIANENTGSVPTTGEGKVNGNVLTAEQKDLNGLRVDGYLFSEDYWRFVGTNLPSVKADPVALTYGAKDNPEATIADVDGAHSGQLSATFENGKTTTENDYYKAELVNEDGAWKVKFTPKKVFSAAENPDGVSVNVKWAYPDGTAIDGVQTPVTVSAINKCPIDKLSLPGDKDGKYAYRIKDAQQKKILKDANDAVKQAVKAIDGKEPTENYMSGSPLLVP